MWSRRLAVARWTRGSTWPGRSSAGDQARVPEANTQAPEGARYRDVSWWRATPSLSVYGEWASRMRSSWSGSGVRGK
jgi:hypothetical protein